MGNIWCVYVVGKTDGYTKTKGNGSTLSNVSKGMYSVTIYDHHGMCMYIHLYAMRYIYFPYIPFRGYIFSF